MDALLTFSGRGKRTRIVLNVIAGRILTAIRWPRMDAACGGLSVAMGLFAGYFDFVGRIEFGEDVWPAMFLLPQFGVFLGFARPVKAWRWALLMSASVFIAHVVGTAMLGYKPADPPNTSPFAPLVSLIPALVGVYLGKALGIIAKHLREHDGTA